MLFGENIEGRVFTSGQMRDESDTQNLGNIYAAIAAANLVFIVRFFPVFPLPA